jgi:uncharacterized protein
MKTEVWFKSGGIDCNAWLYKPDNQANDKIPIIIMAHGFGGLKKYSITPYAQQFVENGYGVLLFDYRHWGDSKGTPRNLHYFKKQLEDWHAAIAYAKTLPFVDVKKIVLWGTSFAGGLVIEVAAKDQTVAATISQCPMLDGKMSSIQFIKNAGILSAMRSGLHGVYDNIKSIFGGVHYVNSIGKPGTVAAMSTEDGYAYLKKTEQLYPEKVNDECYNLVTARTLLTVSKFRPILNAKNVKCPALLLICEKDTVAPAQAVEDAIKLMPNPVPVRYPIGHFDPYFDEGFKMSIKDQLNFLKKYI